jgi:hypothetical protein
MTNEQAKQILQLYRPGTADATDPDFAEALTACEHDAELKQWFATHCALYAAIRSKFKKIAVPEALKEQIIAERPVAQTPAWQKMVLAAGAVAVAVIALITLKPYFKPPEPHDFAAYRNSMGKFIGTGYYQMETNSTDLNVIRSYLAERKSIADFVLPENLQKSAKALGCVTTTWQGKPVSMVCFASGRPTDPNPPSDLWLFISSDDIATEPPKTSTPAFAKLGDLITASWKVGNRTYILAAKSDEQFLEKYLPKT